MNRRSLEAFRLADDLVAIARELDDPDLLLEAYHAQMPGLLWQAEFLAGTMGPRKVMIYDRSVTAYYMAYFWRARFAVIAAELFKR